MTARAAVSAAGVNDLAQTYREAPGGAVGRLMGGGPDELPDRYALADPIALVPLAIPVLLVHGSDDATVSVRRSRNYAEAARARGASVELVEIPADRGRGHLELLADFLDAHHPLAANQLAQVVEAPGCQLFLIVCQHELID